MLSQITSPVISKYKALIGRPRLTLVNIKCGNISCGADDRFKKYKDDFYICKCGFIIQGKFEEIKHKISLYCNIQSCIHGKDKMDINCLKCEHIRER